MIATLRRPVLLGLLLSVSTPVLAQRVAAFAEGRHAIVALLLHYDPELAGDVYPTWRDLASALAPDVRIVVAAGGEADAHAARALAQHAGFERGRVDTAWTDTPPTIWARDRTLFLVRDGQHVAATPSASAVDDDRRADLDVADAVAARFDRFEVRHSRTRFEGGNMLFTRERAIAGIGLLLANLSDPDEPRGPALDELRDLLGAPPLLLGDRYGVPHEHCDMFLTVLGDRTVLLGDPRAGAALLDELLASHLPDTVLPEFDTWRSGTQLDLAPGYDAMRDELESAGFHVERIPILHGDRGQVLTWNNALVEAREDGVRAYVPTYGVPEFDRVAHGVYRSLGFRVFPIDVARLAPHGGTVRCVTNVLAWREPLEPVPPAPRPR